MFVEEYERVDSNKSFATELIIHGHNAWNARKNNCPEALVTIHTTTEKLFLWVALAAVWPEISKNTRLAWRLCGLVVGKFSTMTVTVSPQLTLPF